MPPIFDDEEKKILATLTFFLPLVRSEEFDILKLLLEKPMNEAAIKEALQYNPNYSPEAIRHALLVLQGVGSIPGGAFFIPLIKKDGNGVYSWFKPIGEGPFLDAINDTLEYGLVRYTSDFYARKSDLMRFGFYTGAKALLALSNYKLEDPNSPSLYYESGVQPTSKGLCLFINLEKPANAEERLKYKDRFLSRDILQWESQTGTTLTNTKGQNLIARGKAHIFVRKSKKKGDPFVYLGVGKLTEPKTSDNEAKTLIFKILLEQPIPEEYDYDVGYKEID